ncbi:DUF6074 family protein [Devosia sp. SL43]|uniref:DUF6074 family protein n=1 Tax=Devosia sp. SL43 TaxID=2806348 RepID=UPI001F15E482|nr:DUF6074 family protein [Devosia sp. SL43]UJW83989.1 hypothetical protein IM737_11005 [Devosia sp. SL43]
MAELIIFPQARNVGKARHVAELYSSKGSPKEREIYWRMVVSRLAACMVKCGFSQSAIDQQINSFRNAVQDQLDARPNRATEMEATSGQQRQAAFEPDWRPS